MDPIYIEQGWIGNSCRGPSWNTWELRGPDQKNLSNFVSLVIRQGVYNDYDKCLSKFRSLDYPWHFHADCDVRYLYGNLFWLVTQHPCTMVKCQPRTLLPSPDRAILTASRQVVLTEWQGEGAEHGALRGWDTTYERLFPSFIKALSVKTQHCQSYIREV